MNDTDRQAILFDSNVDYTGTQYIVPIFNAIHHQTVLGIKYQGFNDPNPYDLELHPYILKQYNNRWFVLGYNQFKESYTWNLALDRILAIKEILSNPAKYGFEVENDDLYDSVPTFTVEVDTAVTSWADFAKLYEINYKILKRHNPWLREPHLNNASRKKYTIEIPNKGYYRETSSGR